MSETRRPTRRKRRELRLHRTPGGWWMECRNYEGNRCLCNYYDRRSTKIAMRVREVSR
jgi:hypothetical protein